MSMSVCEGSMTNAPLITSALAVTLERCFVGEIPPHELPWPLPLLWSDGFRTGAEQQKLLREQAEEERDRYYYELHNTAEVKARHSAMLKGFDVALARRTDAEKWAELDLLAAERARAVTA